MDFSDNGETKCNNCTALSAKLDVIKEMLEEQQRQSQQQTLNICKILSEHRVLLNEIINKNKCFDSIVGTFPLNSQDQLEELENIMATEKVLYIRYLKSLIRGNIRKNFREIFGREIVMGFNPDGTHGKKKLKDYTNVYQGIIEAIADDQADKKFRDALQREKKKYFKLNTRQRSMENTATNFPDDSFKSEDPLNID